MLCSYRAQMHTGNSTTSAGFVCVHVRNCPPPSLGFPWTVRLHFLLLNSFFPTAPQRKWSVTAPGPPVCAGGARSACQYTHRNLQDFVLSICLFIESRELCKCCNSLQFFTKSLRFVCIDTLGSKLWFIFATVLQLIVWSKHSQQFDSHLH